MTMQYVKPTEEQLVVMQSFRDKYEALLKDLQTLEKSRGLSLDFEMRRLSQAQYG